MDRRSTVVYLVGAVTVWGGTFLALGILLSGSGRFGEVLAILVGPAVWFVLLVPAGLSWTTRRRREQERKRPATVEDAGPPAERN